MTKRIEIKKRSTDEQCVSQRSVTFDVYVNGEYVETFKDVNDALDRKEELENV